ncbi:PEP-CTERM sorting domain-containing protein [Halorubrum ezzemoulense]|uniref:PEP-CTERM sorting domain-containing protein n=1 Tax=Halorubrum ezzemoulense TaxID=337243 RepID=UPI0037434CF5
MPTPSSRRRVGGSSAFAPEPSSLIGVGLLAGLGYQLVRPAVREVGGKLGGGRRV